MSSACDFSLLTMPNESSVYEVMATFSGHYRQVHTYLSIIICVLGTVCNVCNVVVLTRPCMRTAVNTILCAIALCDITVMVSNLIMICHFNLIARVQCEPQQWSQPWGVFLLSHAQISLVGHSSSIWLSVAMSFLRFMTLKPGRGGRVKVRKPRNELNQSYISIAVVIASVMLFNVPNCFNYHIREYLLIDVCNTEHTNASAFIPVISPTAMANNCLIFRLSYWISGLVFKMLPCVLLTIFITILVRILSEVKKRRDRLMEGPRRISNPHAPPGSGGGSQQTDRTTKMLITVICVFLATELPQGVMTVVTGMIGNEFRAHIYSNLGDVLDLLSLINSCMTFVIYCSMSRQYRAEFRRIFVPKKLATFRSWYSQLQGSTTTTNCTTSMRLTGTNISDNPSVFYGNSPVISRKDVKQSSSAASTTKNSTSKFLTVDYRPTNGTSISDTENSEPLLSTAEKEEHEDTFL